MRLIPVGVGSAGSKIADQLVSYSDESEFDVAPDGLAISATKPALLQLRHLPKQRRVLIGQTATDGHGVGTNNHRGAEAMNDDINDIFYRLNDIDVADTDGFLITMGLGGGMGSGGGPVLARYLQEQYDKPVYAVCVLPSSEEPLHAVTNTMQSLRTLVHHTDNIILFDNDEWLPDDAADNPRADTYRSLNTNLVINLAHLFAVANPEHTTQSSLSTEDIQSTFEAADFSTIGYADRQLERVGGDGLLGRIRGGDAPDDTSDDVRIVLQEAALGRLTAPVSLSSIEAVFAAIAGPPEFFSRRGLEDAQDWLAEQTDSEDIRVGEYPLDKPVRDDEGDEYMSGVVLFSGLTIVERFIEIYDRVVGVDELAGMRGQIQATEVMEAFFADTDAPTPLFTTDEHDASDLRSVDSDLDVDTDVSDTDALMDTEDAEDFDWRSPQTQATDPTDDTEDDTEPEDAESDEDEETDEPDEPDDADKIAGANMFFGGDSEDDFNPPEDDPENTEAENAEIFFDNDDDSEEGDDTPNSGMFEAEENTTDSDATTQDTAPTNSSPAPPARPNNVPTSEDTSDSDTDVNDTDEGDTEETGDTEDGEDTESAEHDEDETTENGEFFEDHSDT